MKGVLIQDHAIAHQIAKSLARAVAAGEVLVRKLGGSSNRAAEAPLRVDEEAGLEMLYYDLVGSELGASVDEIIRAADSRAIKVSGNPEEPRVDPNMHQGLGVQGTAQALVGSTLETQNLRAAESTGVLKAGDQGEIDK